jgi:hypothetical protein
MRRDVLATMWVSAAAIHDKPSSGQCHSIQVHADPFQGTDAMTLTIAHPCEYHLDAKFTIDQKYKF